jgi:hypothetical protein
MDGPIEDELRLRAENAAEAAAAGLLGASVDIEVETGAAAAYLLDASGEVDLLVCGGRGYGAAETVCKAGIIPLRIERHTLSAAPAPG